jgi:hypothetical protein
VALIVAGIWWFTSGGEREASFQAEPYISLRQLQSRPRTHHVKIHASRPCNNIKAKRVRHIILNRVLHGSKQRLTAVRQLRYLASFRLTTVTSFPLAAKSQLL